MVNYYQLSIENTAKSLQTDINQGLNPQQVQERLKTFGPNQLKEKQPVSAWTILIEQFQDFIIWVLIAAAVVSGFLKEWIDSLAILLIVVINAILGFVQEYRAEKSLAALKKLSSPNSKVIRQGSRLIVPSSALVPGDLIELESGDLIAADSRLVYVSPNFSVMEASLTGESQPVQKNTIALEEKEIALGDRINMVYMGTTVSSGKARALVIATAMGTELGNIASMIQTTKKETTPLQRKLEEFGKWIVYACFVLVGIIFLFGIFRGGSLLDMFLSAVSLAVAAIPEGLPAVVTIALALGVQRMVKRNVLIRKLPSVETLGSATVICSDKTGTLTKNEMTVKATYVAKETNETELLKCSVLVNGAELVNNRMLGDPTEGALLVAAANAGIHKEIMEKEYVFVEELPFDPSRKMMSIVRKKNEKYIVFVKGAPDILLDRCVDLSEKNDILAANDKMAGNAMRVLAFAYKEINSLPGSIDSNSIENNLVFLGLMAMIDPPREEVKLAIEKCKAAGIKTIMITGDHKNTAIAIAKELNFFGNDNLALTGEELDKLNEEQLDQILTKVCVYARVSPEHKLRVVRAWKKAGAVVAMTGDGVNDAPAVKEADIGVAMGITGTDVTKEVSDMVVTDDNFASIVAAVEEGRGIFDNIRKFVHYLLSCNTSEILVMFFGLLFGLPLPLLPIQILWVNLVTDSFPALALGMDPVNPKVMSQPARPKNEPVILASNSGLMLLQGLFMALCTLAAFIFFLRVNVTAARSAAFFVLATSQLFHAFNCRDQRISIFKLGLFSNLKLVAATLFSFALLLLAFYTPWLQVVFKTTPFIGAYLLMLFIISSLPLIGMEAVKLALCRK